LHINEHIDFFLILINMSMSQIISQPTQVYNQYIINEIRKTMTDHPVSVTKMNTTGPVVLDDESWKIYKNMLARVAKERANKKPAAIISKKNIRDHRDETFDPIDFSVSQPIVRICMDTFSIVKFKNFDNAVANYQTVAKNDVLKTLKGDLSSFDGYYWIPVSV